MSGRKGVRRRWRWGVFLHWRHVLGRAQEARFRTRCSLWVVIRGSSVGNEWGEWAGRLQWRGAGRRVAEGFVLAPARRLLVDANEQGATAKGQPRGYLPGRGRSRVFFACAMVASKLGETLGVRVASEEDSWV